MIDIEQLVELESGKTYYLRVPNTTSDSEMNDFSDTIKTLDLGCIIIVGRGEFDIEEILDSVRG